MTTGSATPIVQSPESPVHLIKRLESNPIDIREESGLFLHKVPLSVVCN